MSDSSGVAKVFAFGSMGLFVIVMVAIALFFLCGCLGGLFLIA